MNWEKWVLSAFFALNALLIVSLIGKPRKPVAPRDAVIVICINALLVWAVVAS